MPIGVYPRKDTRFCPKGHDTTICGRFVNHGIPGGCKQCKKVYEQSSVGIAQRRNQKYKKKYGISLNDYNEMFRKQNGCCAICAKSQQQLSRSLHVDHSHETGKIRGLLCHACNVRLIPLIENSYFLILKAKAYLEV